MNPDEIAPAEEVITLQGEKTTNTQFKKFDRTQWNKIEVHYDDQITLAVLNAMRLLGNKQAQISEKRSTLKFFGDIYDDIRPLLVEKGFVAETKIKKENKKSVKMNKKEEIIRKNTLVSINKSLDDTLKTYSLTRFNGTYGFNSQYAEIKLLTCIYGVKYLLNKKTPNIPQCYELVLGIRKILNNISTLTQISKTAVSDLTNAYLNLVTFCNFTYNTMFDQFPRLCLMTAYDTVFPSMAIKPYESQKILMNEIVTKKEGLFNYKAMIGTGKTTFIMALCSYVEMLRQVHKAQTGKSTLQIIFTCSVEPVRHQVCKMAYNQSVPFGIGVIDGGTLRVINNFSCKNDNNRILIVADLDATIELLNKSQDYILFVDEPTIGADQTDHPVTRAVAKIIALCPKTTILCSATLPTQEEIPEIINYYQKRHNNTNIVSVCSKDSLIGCEVINFDGSTIAPHNNCKTVNQLSNVIKNLKEKPFIDRLYTAPVVYRLRQKLLENGITDIIDLETYFSNIDTLSQSNIQKAAIELLEKVVEKNNDNLVEKICVPLGKIVIDEAALEKQPEPDEQEEQDIGFEWEQEEKHEINKDENEPYLISEIFTTQAYRYLGGCLVATKDPMKFAFENSKQLLHNCETANRIISKYRAVEDKFNQSLLKLDSIKNEDARSQKEQDMKNDHKPSISFPSQLRVNTPAHLVTYAKHMIEHIDKKQLQYAFNLTTIPLDFNIPDWLMLLLFAGIGVYAPNNKTIDSGYTDYILNLTADGKLSFLISDDNISYGANYPFSHVVIMEDLAKEHSIGTIFQLAGRAGRVGQSWVAYAHVGNETSARIMNYIYGTETLGISDEAKNMITAFNTVIDDIETIRKEKQNDKLTFDEFDKQSKNIIKLSEVKPKVTITNSKLKHDDKTRKEIKQDVKIITKQGVKQPLKNEQSIKTTEMEESWESIVVNPLPTPQSIPVQTQIEETRAPATIHVVNDIQSNRSTNDRSTNDRYTNDRSTNDRYTNDRYTNGDNRSRYSQNYRDSKPSKSDTNGNWRDRKNNDGQQTNTGHRQESQRESQNHRYVPPFRRSTQPIQQTAQSKQRNTKDNDGWTTVGRK
ncbi:helicase [Fadolivirus algeromassiliense]|jgi:hypothetical protein|uniref:Helicase n=1 Tax=Fadolivirus FV1/VV64 TaxID=3070911 RepID=A0A7D3V570_9VIRU|nr:helicase [Fadolivirus algeromassiliense]QKF93615.1 helicase [Fadolivirus FV1/VV64]